MSSKQQDKNFVGYTQPNPTKSVGKFFRTKWNAMFCVPGSTKSTFRGQAIWKKRADRRYIDPPGHGQ